MCANIRFVLHKKQDSRVQSINDLYRMKGDR